MAEYTVTISGHAVLPAWGGPDNFLNVDGRGWTDQQGLGENDGKRFRIRGGRIVDFFVPVTNPLYINDERVQSNAAAVTFELPPAALLTSFQVWDRTTNIFASLPLAVTGNFRRVWTLGSNYFQWPNFPVFGNLVIKVTILATTDSNVTFTGAGIRFQGPTLQKAP